MVVADAIFDGTDMVGPLFRERECFPDQTRNMLPQRVIEALDVIGFPGLLLMARRCSTGIPPV
jgi:hypothetical protein